MQESLDETASADFTVSKGSDASNDTDFDDEIGALLSDDIGLLFSEQQLKEASQDVRDQDLLNRRHQFMKDRGVDRSNALLQSPRTAKHLQAAETNIIRPKLNFICRDEIPGICRRRQ